MIHAATFHTPTAANFTAWQMLGISQLYPCKSPPGPTRKHFVRHQTSAGSWCATGKPPEYKHLTKLYCSLLNFEVFQFPLFLGTFPTGQLGGSGERNLKPASKMGKSPTSQVEGEDVLFSLQSI